MSVHAAGSIPFHPIHTPHPLRRTHAPMVMTGSSMSAPVMGQEKLSKGGSSSSTIMLVDDAAAMVVVTAAVAPLRLALRSAYALLRRRREVRPSTRPLRSPPLLAYCCRCGAARSRAAAAAAAAAAAVSPCAHLLRNRAPSPLSPSVRVALSLWVGMAWMEWAGERRTCGSRRSIRGPAPPQGLWRGQLRPNPSLRPAFANSAVTPALRAAQ